MDKQEGGAPPQEIKENPSPFNLLTNFEATIQAMDEVEGGGWLEAEMNAESNPENLKGAVAYLKKIQSDIDPSNIPEGALGSIHGGGGYSRWMVMYDGEVIFSPFHSGREKEEKAKALGFKIFI